ncbi:MAG: hypothetical protein HQL82_04690 [Magnetococcales bacterium]|nr:hypothetical protein [Magnetococcales bacterium]
MVGLSGEAERLGIHRPAGRDVLSILAKNRPFVCQHCKTGAGFLQCIIKIHAPIKLFFDFFSVIKHVVEQQSPGHVKRISWIGAIVALGSFQTGPGVRTVFSPAPRPGDRFSTINLGGSACPGDFRN